MAERPRYRRRFRPTLDDEQPLAGDVIERDRAESEIRAPEVSMPAPTPDPLSETQETVQEDPEAERPTSPIQGSVVEDHHEAPPAPSTEQDAEPERPHEAEPESPLTLERPVDRPSAARSTEAEAWEKLYLAPVKERHLETQKIITASRSDPAHTQFDVLRTRLLQALSENGWRRVAITSPTQGCGKTFTAANLAISLARQENCRTILFDCDMRRPALAETLGIDEPGAIGDMLRGRTSPAQHLLRLGENDIHAGHNIAFALNDTVEPYAAELLQDPRCVRVLDEIEQTYHPDVMLFDLPPALYYDDVIAMRPLFDGILMVVGGGLTTPREMKEVERRLGVQTPLLGTVLNKAEGTELDRYSY